MIHLYQYWCPLRLDSSRLYLGFSLIVSRSSGRDIERLCLNDRKRYLEIPSRTDKTRGSWWIRGNGCDSPTSVVSERPFP